MFPPHNFNRLGLSLIEVLVAIGVIGLLLGIAIPSILTARGIARNGECQNQVRQLLMDRLEGLNTPDIELISVCPTDPHASFRSENQYAGYVFTGRQPGVRLDRLESIKKSTYKSKHLVLLESADGFYEDSTYFGDLYVYRPSRHYRADLTREKFYATFALKRHIGKSSNVGFGDGHVESISQTYFEKAIEREHMFYFRNADGSPRHRNR